MKIVKTTESPYVSDISGAMSSIYVYNDTQSQVVGDTIEKLLRSVPIEGGNGEAVTRTYNNIQYVPVQTKSFEDIQILLRDDTGHAIPCI